MLSESGVLINYLAYGFLLPSSLGPSGFSHTACLVIHLSHAIMPSWWGTHVRSLNWRPCVVSTWDGSTSHHKLGQKTLMFL